MIVFMLIAASATLAKPLEPLKGQLQAAIWSDLQLNALIGSGNWVASLWYNAVGDDKPDLHIRNLKCTKIRSGQKCAFELFRDNGPTAVLNEVVPDRLTCTATFVRTGDGWSVYHKAPRGARHSATVMKCVKAVT